MHQLHHVIEGVKMFGSIYDVSNLVTDRLQRQAKLSVKGTHDYEQQIINISKVCVCAVFLRR